MNGFNISRQPNGGHDNESGCPRKAIKANQIPSMHQQHGRQPFMFHYPPFDDFRALNMHTFDPSEATPEEQARCDANFGEGLRIPRESRRTHAKRVES